MSKDGIVTIHGKEYQTVAHRVGKFREKYEQNLSIETEIHSVDENTVVMKATIKNKEGFIIATGHAEENRTSSTINKTSALEVCETSAIGRALAALGLAGTEYASADEVANAISQQNKPSLPQGHTFKATKKQLEELFKLAKEQQGFKDQSLALEWLTDQFGKDPREMSLKEASDAVGELRDEPHGEN